jgi:hypothetical protein
LDLDTSPRAFQQAASDRRCVLDPRGGQEASEDPETKERLNYALNPKNKDGYDPKWQKGGKEGGATDAQTQQRLAAPRAKRALGAALKQGGTYAGR